MTLGDFIKVCLLNGADFNSEIVYKDMNFSGKSLGKDFDRHVITVDEDGIILIESELWEPVD